MSTFTRGRSLAVLGAGIAAAAVPSVARGATAVSAGQIGNSVGFFPVYVAQSQGFFKDAGLDVNVTRFQSGTLVGTAVTSGSLDIGCSVITDVFALLKANRPAKIVGSLLDAYYIDIVGSNQFLAAAKVNRKSQLRDKIRALRGKKIGITGPGSGTEALVRYVLQREHLDETRDVTLVNVGADQPSVLAALKTGRIDAVSFAWPLSMIAETENIGEPLIAPALGDVPAMRGEVQAVIYVREDTLAKKEDEVVAFVRAIGRAESLIKKDSAQARTMLKAYNGALSDPAIDQLLKVYLPVLPAQPRVGVATYEQALAFHRETGFAGPSGNAYRDVVALSTIDKAVRA